MQELGNTLKEFAVQGKLIGPGIVIIGLFITGIMIAIPVKSIREFGKENAFWIILGAILIGGAVTFGQSLFDNLHF